MTKWKICGTTLFAIAFVLLVIVGFLVIVAVNSPVDGVTEFSAAPNRGIRTEYNLSVEIEPFGLAGLFVFSIALIAIGAVCFSRG
jgi:hypothetical protein